MEDRVPSTAGSPQPRDLVRVAFGPSLVAFVIIAAVILVQLVVANSELTGTLGAVSSVWLAVHLVPVSIAGQQIGVLPLIPAVLMVWGTARSTAGVTPPRGSWFVIRWIVAAALGGPLFLTALSLAIVHDAASVITELQTPNALPAFSGVLAVHGLGALIGVGSRVRGRLLTRLGLPGWLTDAVRPAIIGAATLLALSCAVLAVSLIVHWRTMHELFGITDSFFGQLSLSLLSLLYLPNVVLGAAAVAVGSSAHIGFATFSSFTVFGGDIPALPILAAVPTPPLGPIWVALLIVGAASGVAIGQQCARRPLPFPLAFAKLAVAALLAAVGLALLALAGGGQLGNFGRVGVDQATFGPAVFFWFFLIGALTVVMTGGISRRPAPAARPDPPDSVDQVREPGSRSASDPGDPAESVPQQTGEAAEAGDTDETAEVGEAAQAGDTGETAEPTETAGPDGEQDAKAEPAPEPGPPPPPVRPAPDLTDVEDLMFVDADIDTDGPLPPVGSG